MPTFTAKKRRLRGKRERHCSAPSDQEVDPLLVPCGDCKRVEFKPCGRRYPDGTTKGAVPPHKNRIKKARGGGGRKMRALPRSTPDQRDPRSLWNQNQRAWGGQRWRRSVSKNHPRG